VTGHPRLRGLGTWVLTHSSILRAEWCHGPMVVAAKRCRCCHRPEAQGRRNHAAAKPMYFIKQTKIKHDCRAAPDASGPNPRSRCIRRGLKLSGLMRVVSPELLTVRP